MHEPGHNSACGAVGVWHGCTNQGICHAGGTLEDVSIHGQMQEYRTRLIKAETTCDPPLSCSSLNADSNWWRINFDDLHYIQCRASFF